jgi:hypothetical protein
MKYSTNDQLILSKYDYGGGLKQRVKSGFASTEQKTNLVGLDLLVDAHLIGGKVLKAGSVIYFEEEFVYSDNIAKRVRTGMGLSVEFMVLDIKRAVAVEEKE